MSFSYIYILIGINVVYTVSIMEHVYNINYNGMIGGYLC